MDKTREKNNEQSSCNVEKKRQDTDKSFDDK